MTYDDIADWASDAYPPDNYDNFNEWLQDVANDFSNSGHFLPADAIEIMRNDWNDQKDIEDEFDEDSEMIREQRATPSVSENPATGAIEYDDVEINPITGETETVLPPPRKPLPMPGIQQYEKPIIIERPIIITSGQMQNMPQKQSATRVVEVRQVEGRKQPSRVTGFLKRLMRRKAKK